LKIKIIGDVHGKVSAYNRIIKTATHSIQLGDFGFKQEWEKLTKNRINYEKHKIIPGNHDAYDHINLNHTFGKDYGLINFDGFKFFFLRGAFSTDKKYRTEGVDWFQEEEVSYNNLWDAFKLYETEKSDIILTHDCPDSVIPFLFNRYGNKNRTTTILSDMFEIHKPKLWIFGHWHETTNREILGTEFVCLAELDYIEYDTEQNIEWNIEQIKKQIHDKSI